MTNEDFIKTILQKGKEAKDKVKSEFSNISLEQLNWKPLLKSWSIAQCLDHLIASHSAYFPILKRITERNYKINSWEKYSPFTSISGRLLIRQFQEQPKRKFKAPKKIQPSTSQLELDVLNDYYNNLDIFLDYISNCDQVDLDKTIITSPTISIVTYSLRDAFQFLMQHEHRHVNQAIRVKTNAGFPKN